MKRIVVGLTGARGSGKTTIANFMAEKGFKKISINDKVRDMAIHFFSDDEMRKNEDAILTEMRIKGFATSPAYWLNLALISVSDKHNLIVIDDVHEAEAINGNIHMYQVFRPLISKSKIDNIDIILNDSNLDSLHKVINDICDSLKK